MEKMKLSNGELIDRNYFENTLKELSQESWSLKPISELLQEHVNCLLSMETISKTTVDFFYESDKNNIISVNAYKEYIEPF
ncbi:MAG TPA: hypothetical protein VMY77_18825 [Chitinophagaceae bacterium]|nr:hypothetical protein [Chitinophagaceae bacterium]